MPNIRAKQNVDLEERGWNKKGKGKGQGVGRAQGRGKPRKKAPCTKQNPPRDAADHDLARQRHICGDGRSRMPLTRLIPFGFGVNSQY